jgi:hypothetical protein
MKMPNEYNGTLLVLRDTNGTQMSLARFFQLALDDGNGHTTFPSQGKSSGFDPNHHAWDMATGGEVETTRFTLRRKCGMTITIIQR